MGARRAVTCLLDDGPPEEGTAVQPCHRVREQVAGDRRAVVRLRQPRRGANGWPRTVRPPSRRPPPHPPCRRAHPHDEPGRSDVTGAQRQGTPLSRKPVTGSGAPCSSERAKGPGNTRFVQTVPSLPLGEQARTVRSRDPSQRKGRVHARTHDEEHEPQTFLPCRYHHPGPPAHAAVGPAGEGRGGGTDGGRCGFVPVGDDAGGHTSSP